MAVARACARGGLGRCGAGAARGAARPCTDSATIRSEGPSRFTAPWSRARRRRSKRRPTILPGLRLPPGSTPSNRPRSIATPGAEMSCSSHAACSVPTAWWCDSVPPESTNACWIADLTTSYSSSGVAPARRRDREREVEARARVVGVRQVAHDVAAHAELGERAARRGRHAAVQRRRARSTAPRSRTRPPARRGRAGSRGCRGCRTSSGRTARPGRCRCTGRRGARRSARPAGARPRRGARCPRSR